jgi:hypothetical protein
MPARFGQRLLLEFSRTRLRQPFCESLPTFILVHAGMQSFDSRTASLRMTGLFAMD